MKLSDVAVGETVLVRGHFADEFAGTYLGVTDGKARVITPSRRGSSGVVASVDPACVVAVQRWLDVE